MAREPRLGVIVEDRQHRTTDHVGAGGLSRTHHQLEPVGRGDLVVVDHQEAGCCGKQRLRGLEGGVDRLAIALALLDEADALEPTVGEIFGRDRRTLARRTASFSTITTAKERGVR